MGERYQQRLRTFFERDEPPNFDPVTVRPSARLKRLWQDTAPFRAALDAAASRTAAKAGLASNGAH